MSGVLTNNYPDERADIFLRNGTTLGVISAEVYLLLNEKALKRRAVADCLQNMLLRLDFLTVREYLVCRGREPFEDMKEIEDQVKEQYFREGLDIPTIQFDTDANGDVLFPQRYHGTIEVVVMRKVRKDNERSVGSGDENYLD